MPSPSPAPRASIINPEADRRLTRLALLYGGASFLLLIVLTVGMPILNTVTHLAVWPKRILNDLSLLVVMIPFLTGTNRMNAARLEIGRERVQARAWTEAVAALQPLDGLIQRFFDVSGEAHYLLGQAYAGLGDKARAEKARAFVRRKSGSPWAEKLQTGKGPAIVRPNAASRAKIYDGQEKRPAPPKSKPRRRF